MRNHMIVSIIITMLTIGLFMTDAAAKRFGAGRSFGIQRAKSALFFPHMSQTKSAKSTFTQNRNTSRWGGLIGGLLIGGLLTSLFMGHGLGTGILSWLIIAFIAYATFAFLRKKMHPAFQAANSTHFQPRDAFTQHDNMNNTSHTINSTIHNRAQNDSNDSQFTNHSAKVNIDYPSGFIPETFLNTAKTNFLHLQKASDQNNLQDLMALTTPEMLPEIKMQLEEREAGLHHTEIINLEAKLLDVQKQEFGTMASVHFTGQVKENSNSATILDEIWHFRQFNHNSAWVVGGVQQREHLL